MHVDVVWFRQRKRRQARIRRPEPGEFSMSWRVPGMHDASRRYVVVARCPKTPATPDGLMRIPFLAAGDESIEDDDVVVLRLLDDLMKDAAKVEHQGGFAITGGPGAFPGWKW